MSTHKLLSGTDNNCSIQFTPILISNEPPQIEHDWCVCMHLNGYFLDDIHEALEKCNGDEKAAGIYLKEHYQAGNRGWNSH